jgi:hypothetical protein
MGLDLSPAAHPRIQLPRQQYRPDSENWAGSSLALVVGYVTGSISDNLCSLPLPQ